MAGQPQINLFSAHGYWLSKRFRDGGGQTPITGAKVTAVEGDSVIYEKDGAGKRDPCRGPGMIITALVPGPPLDLSRSWRN